ncbi:MAG: hypothetical protein JJU33_04415 [Phycisphaerales bacterium]|nr:hypothetical protein [Phycisphaerales bacterium]
MPTGRKIAECIHLVALGLWLGSLVMTALVAAQVFKTMRELGPVLPDYGTDPADHWRIVAGHVGEFTFFSNDVIQFLCVLLAVVSLIASVWLYRLSLRRISTAVRSMLLGAAGMMVAYQLMLLGPEMNAELRAYWRAAQAGDASAAAAHRDAFAALHPRATTALSATMLAVLGCMVAGVWSITSDPAMQASSRPGEAKLEPPALGTGPL